MVFYHIQLIFFIYDSLFSYILPELRGMILGRDEVDLNFSLQTGGKEQVTGMGNLCEITAMR